MLARADELYFSGAEAVRGFLSYNLRLSTAGELSIWRPFFLITKFVLRVFGVPVATIGSFSSVRLR